MATPGLASRVTLVIGIVVSILAGFVFASVVRDIVRAIRFSGGGDVGGAAGTYIAAYNFTASLVDGAIALVFALIAFLLVRRHLAMRSVQVTLWAIAVVGVGLGIFAGLA